MSKSKLSAGIQVLVAINGALTIGTIDQPTPEETSVKKVIKKVVHYCVRLTDKTEKTFTGGAKLIPTSVLSASAIRVEPKFEFIPVKDIVI